MKNIRYFLSASLVIATLSGCGGWNEDPLAGKNEAFKNAQQKPTLPEAPKAIGSDAIRLDADYFKFTEAKAGEFKISSRVLEPGYTPTIYIENMTDFPGAVFSPSQGKFFWTPPVGTVSGDSGIEETRVLKVHVVANKPNATVLTQDFKLDLRVSKMLNVPEIFSVSKSSAELREGDMMNVTVKVRDKDAGSTFPTLQISPVVGFGNISQFVTVTQTLSLGSGEYLINLNIDLSNAEMTKSRSRYGFKLKAISRFQKESSSQDVYINVLTSFADLQSTWFAPLDVPLGIKKEFQFMIFDPKEELFVAQPVWTGLPYGASINCSGVNVTRQFCTFSWTPDFTVSPGTYTISASVMGRNQDSNDIKTEYYPFKMDLNVTSAPPVSPMTLQGGH